MIWLAGGRPFSTSNDGKNVTINLTDDEGTRTFTEFWQKMIDEGLVATNLTTWSDEWKEAVGEGRSPLCSPAPGCRRCSCRTFLEPQDCGVWHRCPRRMAVIPRRKTAVRHWPCCSVRANRKPHIVSSNTHVISRRASKRVWPAARSCRQQHVVRSGIPAQNHGDRRAWHRNTVFRRAGIQSCVFPSRGKRVDRLPVSAV